jgi:hypothetical protein
MYGLRWTTIGAGALLLASALSGCSSVGPWIGDHLPHAVGGLPKDVPPRAGDPGYEEWQQQMRSKGPKEPGQKAGPKNSAASE